MVAIGRSDAKDKAQRRQNVAKNGTDLDAWRGDSVAIRSRLVAIGRADGRNRSQFDAKDKAQRRQNVAKNGIDLDARRRFGRADGRDWSGRWSQSVGPMVTDTEDKEARHKKKPDHLIGKSGLLLLLCVACL